MIVRCLGFGGGAAFFFRFFLALFGRVAGGIGFSDSGDSMTMVLHG
jgi:hypothetical protein